MTQEIITAKSARYHTLKEIIQYCQDEIQRLEREGARVSYDFQQGKVVQLLLMKEYCEKQISSL